MMLVIDTTGTNIDETYRLESMLGRWGSIVAKQVRWEK